MQNNLKNFGLSYKLNSKIDELNRLHIEKMNILYELHKRLYNLYDHYSIDSSECLIKLKDYYNKGWIECLQGRDIKFYKALNKFRTIYENGKSSIPKSGKTNKMLLLPELVSSQSSQPTGIKTRKIGLNLISMEDLPSDDGLHIIKDDNVYYSILSYRLCIYPFIKIILFIKYNYNMRIDVRLTKYIFYISNFYF